MPSDFQPEQIWAGIVRNPTVAPGTKLARATGTPEELARLLRHWQENPSARPRLRGLSATPEENTGPGLQLLLEMGADASLALLEISAAKAFPRPSGLWEYATWWENELEHFQRVAFEGARADKGAAWLPL